MNRKTRLFFACAGLVLAPCSMATAANVYVMASGQAATDDAVIAVLTSHGHTVTLGVRFQEFNGTQSLAGFDTVYIQANFNWNAGPLSAAGAQALTQWVRAGGRLVLSEWVIFLSISAFWELREILPGEYGVGGTHWNSTPNTTYRQDLADPIISAGVPSELTFTLVSYSGTETYIHIKPRAIMYYRTLSSPTQNPFPGVIGRREGEGSVYWFSTTCGPAQLQDANFGRLFSNVMNASVPCYANCDGSTVHPTLNIDDFTCFINAFASGQALPHAEQIVHYANCDGSTSAPVLNIDDFTCFINAFATACD